MIEAKETSTPGRSNLKFEASAVRMPHRGLHIARFSVGLHVPGNVWAGFLRGRGLHTPGGRGRK
jgi:hypothetical protein